MGTAKHFRAARERWERRRLECDLKSLGHAIAWVRGQILKRARHEKSVIRRAAYNRVKALQYFHLHGNANRRGRNLEKHFRRAVASGQKIKAKRRAMLGKASRRVLLRQNGIVERQLSRRLQRRFAAAFGARKASHVIMELTGTSLAGVRAHLESLFQPGMTWENRGFRGWHIDHKKPICTFNLNDPDECRACFHYTNLQPLWMADNFKKGKRFCAPGRCATVQP